MIYNKMLIDSITREKNGTDYICPKKDQSLLRQLFDEIGQHTGTHIQYLAEIDALHISGSGEIIARYITRFSSESVKGYLLPSMVADKVKDCDRCILQLYEGFRASEEYIGAPGKPAPAHIYVRYDNAFRQLKPKRLANELVMLVHDPRDAFYLPFTVRMLASWKIPEMANLLVSYLNSDTLTAAELGVYNETMYPSPDFIKRELKFTGIAGAKYYPFPEIKALIEEFTDSQDKDLQLVAKRTLKAMQ